MGAQQGSREIKSLYPLPVQPVEQAELSEKSNKGVMMKTKNFYTHLKRKSARFTLIELLVMAAC